MQSRCECITFCAGIWRCFCEQCNELKKIRNIAKQKNIPAQVVLQNYMFERLLVRLSASDYKEKLVLKGGMLVAAIVGLDNRATMDMDALKTLLELQ